VTQNKNLPSNLIRKGKRASDQKWETFINLKGHTHGTIGPMVNKQVNLCKGA